VARVDATAAAAALASPHGNVALDVAGKVAVPPDHPATITHLGDAITHRASRVSESRGLDRRRWWWPGGGISRSRGP
jgi:hypothetical protein